MVLLAIHGRFWSLRFHCLLSALLCCWNMCTQVSSRVSKLEITRLLQPLYVFKSSRAHLRRCVFCSSVSKWGIHLAQTFSLFQNCLHAAFWYASTTSYIFNRQSRILFDHNLYSSDVSLGNRGFRQASRMGIIFHRKFPSFNPPKNCARWNGLRSIYIPHNSLNICFESILSLLRHLIWLRISVFWSIFQCNSKLVSVNDCIYFNLK